MHLEFDALHMYANRVGRVCTYPFELPACLANISPPLTYHNRKLVWCSQQEIAQLLLGAAIRPDWLSPLVHFRPRNGTMVFYNRQTALSARRNDGYLWKRKPNRRTAKEVHMVLKVDGLECILANYAHSALLSTFHRRTYSLRYNPSIVLVHYLNVPSITQDDKLCLPLPTFFEEDRSELSRNSVLEQLLPMFSGFPNYISRPQSNRQLHFDVQLVLSALCSAISHRLQVASSVGEVSHSTASRTGSSLYCLFIPPTEVAVVPHQKSRLHQSQNLPDLSQGQKAFIMAETAMPDTSEKTSNFTELKCYREY
ncbi:uncharacterized protein DEA37_0003092 [Paragonimus westermani]|uniref:CG-1 domain-containing protein n=1 Tax=Paragonimus westermani TaxID=34504 RepID=A0A5J4N5U1_9TREM|nr:uncharacterized protein DEA37_0003092 [Paragonimus westermani]